MWRGRGMHSRGRGFGHRHRQDLGTGDDGLRLVDLPPNQEAEVVGLTGPFHFCRRLAHMGLHVGAKVKVIQQMGWHSIVQVGDCKVGLGMRAASGVLVRIIDGEGK